jgi:hypothetical protein
MGTSNSFAYKIIKQLNTELEAKGFITVAGKVSRQYFHERVYGYGKEGMKNAGV